MLIYTTKYRVTMQLRALSELVELSEYYEGLKVF